MASELHPLFIYLGCYLAMGWQTFMQTVERNCVQID